LVVAQDRLPPFLRTAWAVAQLYSNEEAAFISREAQVILLGLLAGGGAMAQDAVRAVLARHCYSCHNARSQAANLNLDRSDIQPAMWEKVLDKLAAGRMPPPGSPAPSRSEVALVTSWIEAHLGSAADPWHVTTRRLNRDEYRRTIDDLLGVATRPSDGFPLDDTGYGFDNIGDVLSVSPLLMEKYMEAAREISKAAIYGAPAPARPTKLVRYLSKKSQDDPTAGALPYSYRGAIWGSFLFPADGEYELRMRVGNYRPRGTGSARMRELFLKRTLTEAERAELAEENRKAYPPVTMVLQFDGVPILTEVVEGNIDYKYAHGESVGRVKVKAGEHRFRASFPEFAGMENPRDNVNLDGRRKLFIDYVDIVGPFRTGPAAQESRGRIFICAEQTPECARRIVEALAARAYRRPPEPSEIEGLLNLAAQVRRRGDSFEESIRVALQAVLTSPHFLFRVERPEGAYGISQYDLASRLSYFLWSSMPDGDLLRAAGEGRLREPAELRRQVRRMLESPKSVALVENFVGQWLGLRLLDRRRPDPARFPLADDELLESMRQETLLFARAILREDRSVLDFLDGRFSFVNGPLARFYGIPGVRGEEFERVSLDGLRRGGVVSQASVLTLSSYATRTSPVLRGKWVLENLLGTPPPPPPGGVPPLAEADLGAAASLRERLEQHRAKPECAACHDSMDPIGFRLENYDASGAWRDRDGRFPIDPAGPAELRRELRSQPAAFARNLTEKMMTYALGRGLERQDRPEVARVAARLADDGYRFSTLIQEIVAGPAFQGRRAGMPGEKNKEPGGNRASR
jgi:mono/diheme cytochrome c family protein